MLKTTWSNKPRQFASQIQLTSRSTLVSTLRTLSSTSALMTFQRESVNTKPESITKCGSRSNLFSLLKRIDCPSWEPRAAQAQTMRERWLKCWMCLRAKTKNPRRIFSSLSPAKTSRIFSSLSATTVSTRSEQESIEFVNYWVADQKISYHFQMSRYQTNWNHCT